MSQGDLNSLFARAEQAFTDGRLDEADRILLALSRAAGDHPAILHLLALVKKGRGLYEEARNAFSRALTLTPGDPQINNNFANLLDQMGEPEAALKHLDRALEAAPQLHDARFNRALILQQTGRHTEALSELEDLCAASPTTAKFHSARAAALRQSGRLREAAEAYDAALRLDPRRRTALHGRARTALELGDPVASAYFKRALGAGPDDMMLRLGLAEALEAEGKPGAVEALAAAVDSNPQWVEGQAALARMRWEAGEGVRFTRNFESALEQAPANVELWFAYASALAQADLFGEAAEAAARGRALAGDDHRLQLLEAVHSSEANELDRADRLFARLPEALPGRSIHEVRHAVRRKQYERALQLCARSLEEDRWSVTAWAMTGLLWRVLGDPRASWLHEQPGLVAVADLDMSTSQIDAAAHRLRILHRTRSHPIGQSLRGGTQTRGRLFEREEPEIQTLRKSVESAVEAYWARLPAPDPDHPLLRHRASRPRFGGSWSVRLVEGGFHVSHVHPEGVLSSASYLVVPEPRAPEEGWLEIGGPPAELGLPLEPLLKVEPAPGKLALFPSTLFHGTRPFADGERLTAAFDVVPA